MFLKAATDFTLVMYLAFLNFPCFVDQMSSLLRTLSLLINLFLDQRPSSLADRSVAKLQALRDELDRDRQRHGPYVHDVVVNYDEKALAMVIEYEKFARQPSMRGWLKALFQQKEMSVWRLVSAYHAALHQRIQSAAFSRSVNAAPVLPQFPPLAVIV